MKPIWKNQPKFLDIKSSMRPTKDYPLSGVVLFSAGKRQGFFYCEYDWRTVEMIAKHMPRGISREDPANLLIIESPEVYQVYCKYVNTGEGILLWQQEEKPKWYRGLKIM